jgi:UDPglucose--hexose-1-phosphate uridylyltransferase
MQNELRKSYDTENWSVIASLEPSSVGCALCPGSEDKTEETFKISDPESKTGAWLCRSIVDPYPITHPMAFKLNQNSNILQSFKAHGWSEVVIETRSHTKELHELNIDEIKAVLQIYADRSKAIENKEGVEQVCITKDNLRTEFDHSYSKVFTLPIVPKKMKEKVDRFNDYHYKNESCLYCDLIKNERNSPRIIFENDHFICFVPFSPIQEYEVMIVPKKHCSNIYDLNEFEIFTLAETLKNVLTRMSAVIKPLKYWMVFYLKPNKEKDFHFHIGLGPKSARSTVGDGYSLHVCKIAPEDAAGILRGKS